MASALALAIEKDPPLSEFGSEHEVTINKDSNKIAIIGWAFDARKISAVQNLYVHSSISMTS